MVLEGGPRGPAGLGDPFAVDCIQNLVEIRGHPFPDCPTCWFRVQNSRMSSKSKGVGIYEPTLHEISPNFNYYLLLFVNTRNRKYPKIWPQNRQKRQKNPACGGLNHQNRPKILIFSAWFHNRRRFGAWLGRPVRWFYSGLRRSTRWQPE